MDDYVAPDNSRQKIYRHIHINHGPDIEKGIEYVKAEISKNEEIRHLYSTRYLSIKLLENDKSVEKVIHTLPNSAEIFAAKEKAARKIQVAMNEDSESAITNAKYGFITGALKETFIDNHLEKDQMTKVLDTIVTHKIWGYPIFFLFMRITKDGKNQMLKDSTLSDTARKAIAGMMCLAPSITAFGNTTPTSYFRLVPHQEAPTNICWGDRNRSVLVRVPLGWSAKKDMCALANPLESPSDYDTTQKQTVEMRSPDGSADIYQLLASLAVACRHGDKIVFSYAGDLYSVNKSGGTARKLTSNIGYEMFPHFSPDGKQIAFTGQYDGNTEVFIMPAEGGEPKRLTYTATLGRDDLGDRMNHTRMQILGTSALLKNI